MKISNQKKIRSLMYLIATLMIICGTSGILIFLLQLPAKEIFYIILAVAMVILTFIFKNLKTIIYEDSGEVVTIKLFHPLENKIYCPTVEFPARQLKDYGIRKTFQGYNMALTLESLRKKEIKREFRLTAFGRIQLESIISSLEQTKKMNTTNR